MPDAAQPNAEDLDPAALEAMARQLEASGRYRLLRRFEACTLAPSASRGPVKDGLYLDTETTGTDPAKDEIIELAMVPFQYDADGRICAVGEPFVALREPSVAISDEITRITGITAEMVAGKTIDPSAVAAFIAPAAVVIAHNAQFDRRFVERLWEGFTLKGWACSMTQIDWKGEGFEGTKLAYLAGQCGFFFDGHRAENDCLAGLEILSRPLKSDRTGLSHLLETARKPSWRIWAERSPFELKEKLKARGYRWNGEEGPAPKAWYIDVDEADRQAELTFLEQENLRRRGPPSDPQDHRVRTVLRTRLSWPLDWHARRSAATGPTPQTLHGRLRPGAAPGASGRHGYRLFDGERWPRDIPNPIGSAFDKTALDGDGRAAASVGCAVDTPRRPPVARAAKADPTRIRNAPMSDPALSRRRLPDLTHRFRCEGPLPARGLERQRPGCFIPLADVGCGRIWRCPERRGADS